MRRRHCGRSFASAFTDATFNPQSQKRAADFNPGGEPTYPSEFDGLTDSLYGTDFGDSNLFPSSSFTFTSNLDGFFDLGAASGDQTGLHQFDSSPATIHDGPTPKTDNDGLAGPADWPPTQNLSSSNTSPGSGATSPGFGNYTSRTSPSAGDANGNGLSSSGDSAADMQNLMNLFYSANARTHNSAAANFTHINPSQVLGGSATTGDSSSGPTSNGDGDSRGQAGTLSSNYPSPIDSPHHAPTPPVTKRPIASSKASSSSRKRSESGQPSIDPPGLSRASSSQRIEQSSSPADLAVSSAVPKGPLLGGQTKKATFKAEKKATPPTPGASNDSVTPEGFAPPPAVPPRPSGDAPTICSNCHTTNTPLWRRDPDGNPLCNVRRNLIDLSDRFS